MPRSPQTHISNALTSLAKAQDALNKEVQKHTKILAIQGQDIARLEQTVADFRTSAVKFDLSSGMTGREVAAKYRLSEGRISQLKNS